MTVALAVGVEVLSSDHILKHTLKVKQLGFADGLDVECEWKDGSQSWLWRSWFGLGLGYIGSLLDMLSLGCLSEVHVTSNPTPRQTRCVSLEFWEDRSEEWKTCIWELTVYGYYLNIWDWVRCPQRCDCVCFVHYHIQCLEHPNMWCISEWSKQQPMCFLFCKLVY